MKAQPINTVFSEKIKWIVVWAGPEAITLICKCHLWLHLNVTICGERYENDFKLKLHYLELDLQEELKAQSIIKITTLPGKWETLENKLYFLLSKAW